MAVKIKDVAQRAGVSVTSVSRVLNGEKYVSEDILQRVQKAIEELQYSPSHIARSLKRQKTDLIGVIVPDLTSNFYSTILSSIEETATYYGYNLLVCNIAEDLEKELKYLNIFREMRVDGIIIMHEKSSPELLSFIQNSGIPILYSSVKSPDPDFVSVIIDDYQAAFQTVEYLVSLGHSRIAYIGGDMRDITSGQYRYEGFRAGLLRHGITPNEAWIRFGDYKIPSGREQMSELLQLSEWPTVVFAASDDMAVGALNCMLDQGLDVPKEMSLIGFDGSIIAEVVRPALTSMQQPIREMGKVSLETLHEMIMRPGKAVRKDLILSHQLVERESCLPLSTNKTN
ncbi:LacI family DNA-binding transcriptional regulator [Paenibacillus barcinonensis]|uniref:LacI family DNA-binding transcriptional regulator n=1 Tax=Paenibacillus barcinonensis TaxID=198119 RepID=A0A2V4VC78_PAEBA|nr:LacI family DNA-binding transcriptional regulator [Paenibacillus barcinonensis]PYE50168.1 LacI family transcriptional regulator [Paenibacillus barcinonensis]QKS54871.1 LacI family DNA-binding transcriptional regulator [Paenibacillus barcinonensis]